MEIMQQSASQYKDDDSVNFFSFQPGSLFTPGVAEHISEDALTWDDKEFPRTSAYGWRAQRVDSWMEGSFGQIGMSMGWLIRRRDWLEIRTS